MDAADGRRACHTGACAKGGAVMADSTKDTEQHIWRVRWHLDKATHNLVARGLDHDLSKYGPEEKPGYDIISEVMQGHALGTPEYSAAMGAARQRPEVAGAIEHHYAVNDHHPEHHPEGVAGMSLLSLVEMLADWKAASERSGGTISLAFQIERFGIEPQLARILENTVKELGW